MTANILSSSPSKRTPWWLWLNVLSLDAPLVAVLWQAALAHSYRVKLLPGAPITLFLAVWLIYLADRILDSFAPVATEQMSARHAFYRRNRRLLIALVLPAAAALLGMLAVSAIPAAIMLRGVVLSYLVALYLLHFAARKHRALYIAGNLLLGGLGLAALWWLPLPHQFRTITSSLLVVMVAIGLMPKWHGVFRLVPKELICGYIFAVGCSLSVGFYTMDSHAGPFSPEVLLMALLFALNCVAISCYERETDAATDPTSISQTWPGMVRMYPALLVTFGVFAGLEFSKGLRPEMIFLAAAVTLSTALLAALHVFARRLTPELSRVLADAAIALPIVLLIVRN